MSEQKGKQSLPRPEPWFLNRGLFSDHFLKARLPGWKEWQCDTELSDFRKKLTSLYESTKTILPNANEAQTEKEFVQPVLDLLGYANSYIVQVPARIGEHTNRPDYALFPDQMAKNKAYEMLKANDYTLCIGIADAKYWERELDLAKSSDRDTFTNQNPSFQIASYLTGTKQTWGILTNGRLWRLYCAKSHLPLGNYYQVDLVQLLGAPEEALKYFYLFFRKAALVTVDGKSFLDRVLEDSNQYAVELEADIKERAYEVVELLCRGFAAGFSPDQLTEQTLRTVYDNSLTLLYRLLFVFYAEARDLLPLTTNQTYRDKYSLHRLTQEIDEALAKGYQLSAKSSAYYNRAKDLFKLINEGDPGLGVPEYNGGLFNPDEHPFLEKHAIADTFLVQAIHQLARIPDKKLGREVAVDYNTLSERHLGSIYEGLLEFKPRIAESDLVIIKEKGNTKYAPADKYPERKVAYKKGELYLVNDKGERKATGSYYTPEYIVNYIVENTLDPLTKEAHEKVKALKPEVDKAIAKWEKLKEQKRGLEPTEKYDRAIAKEREKLLEPYLSLKVLDPAMGSGHFLARATDFLAEAIATDPCIKPPGEIGEDSELTYYRRRVVESCIYGVDLNPLAVELAKLTLWLKTMAKSKPLSFLDHHLRCGNSLIGARLDDIQQLPSNKKKVAPSPEQLALFDKEALAKDIGHSVGDLALIQSLPSNTIADIKEKERILKELVEARRLRYKRIADLWVSHYFGNEMDNKLYRSLSDMILGKNTFISAQQARPYLERAEALAKEKHFFHWELEFPEVFYDEKGNRKPNAGFDAVIGNPPHGAEIDVPSKTFLKSTFRTASGDFDSAAVFYELSSRLAPKVFLVMPKPVTFSQEWSTFRMWLWDKGILRCLDVSKAFEGVKHEQVILHVDQCSTQVSYRGGTAEAKAIVEKALIPVAYSKVQDVLLANFSEHEIRVLRKLASLGKLDAVSVFRGLPRKLETGVGIPCAIGDDIKRYYFEPSRYIGSSALRDNPGPGKLTAMSNRKLIAQRIVAHIEKPVDHIELMFSFDEKGTPTFETVENLVFEGDLTSYHWLLALLNSKFMSWYAYRFVFNKAIRTMDLDQYYIRKLPMRWVSFITAESERKQLLEKAKKLYEKYLVSHNWDDILAFVAECLPQKADGTPDLEHEKSDVVHDLLAFLAEEMTRLNKEKQSKIKGFLTWLEKEILKGPVEDQKNKTKIKDFHNGTFEDLLDVLKRNKVVPDPCPSGIRDTIASEFSAVVSALVPLKSRIQATDALIDQIVYKLYGLTDDEIAIVEGQETRKKKG